MTLPANGLITLGQIDAELGFSTTAAITLNDAAVRTLLGVASGPIFLSNGYGKTNAVSITTANSWTTHPTPNAAMTDTIWTVKFANGSFMLLSVTYNYSNQAFFSTDGLNWTAHFLPSTISTVSATGGNGKFVVMGYPNNYVTANNGVTWTAISTTQVPGRPYVNFANGQFIGIEYSNIYKSTDGVTWTTTYAAGGPTASSMYILWTGTRYVFIPSGYSNTGYASPNLTTWTTITSLSPSAIASGCSMAVATNGNGVIVIAPSIYNNWTVSVSVDHGATWQDVVIPSGYGPGGTYQSKIDYGNGVFVISAQDNAMVSADGLHWTTFQVIGQQYASSAYGNGTWVMASLNGPIAMSP